MTWRGWEDFVPPSQAVPARKSKYGAEPTTVDGLRFASKREAARYRVLKLRMQAREIRNLQCQPIFALKTINGVEVAQYVADFEYDEIGPLGWGDWVHVVEDVKGARTDVYKLKKRWFEKQYGITIRET